MLCYFSIPSLVSIHCGADITHVHIVFPISHWIFRTYELTKSVIATAYRNGALLTKSHHRKAIYIFMANKIKSKIQWWFDLGCGFVPIYIEFIQNDFWRWFQNKRYAKLATRYCFYSLWNWNAIVFDSSILENMIGKEIAYQICGNSESKFSCYTRLPCYYLEYLIRFTIKT